MVPLQKRPRSRPYIMSRNGGFLLALVLATGCMGNKQHQGRASRADSGKTGTTNRVTSSSAAEAQKTAITNAAPSKPADDTAHNKADAQQDTLTPLDQGESALDRGITQAVRQDVVRGKDGQHFSFLAQNIKIISINGELTLRGVVKTEREKDAIEALAQNVRGVKKVNNQLEVKGQSR